MRATLNENNIDHLPPVKNTFIKIKKMVINGLSKKNISFVMLTIGLCGVIIAYRYQSRLHESHLSSLQMKRNEQILHVLNDVNGQLASLSKTPANNVQKQALLKIENDLVGLQQSIIEVAKSSDIQKVSSQISSVKEDMDEHMSDIKRAVSDSMGNKQFLNANVLPFHVISIDVIGGQPYVSVNYADHVTPVGVSDVLAGWRLILADYDASVAEFVNDKDQYVKVSLQG